MAGSWATSEMLSAENFGSNGTGPDGVVVDGPFSSEMSTTPLDFHDLTIYTFIDWTLHLGPGIDNTEHYLSRVVDETNTTYTAKS